MKYAWIAIVGYVVFALAAVALVKAYEKRGFDAGFEAGKAEAQTPAFIVETCSAWWWGSNREATKMLKKYCEMKK